MLPGTKIAEELKKKEKKADKDLETAKKAEAAKKRFDITPFNDEEDKDKKAVAAPKEKYSEGDKSAQKEVKNLLSRLHAMSVRGLDDAQIGRALPSSFGKDVPKYELIPLLDTLRSFMAGYDPKAAQAQGKYNLKAKDDYKAMDKIARLGDPKFAIEQLDRKLNALYAVLDGMKEGPAKAKNMELAAELNRHLAVFYKAVDYKKAYECAQRSVELNPEDIKSLDVLGYMELSFENIASAERCFNQAYRLEIDKDDRTWLDLALEGLKIVGEHKADESAVHAIKGPDKLKTFILKPHEIAALYGNEHYRKE